MKKICVLTCSFPKNIFNICILLLKIVFDRHHSLQSVFQVYAIYIKCSQQLTPFQCLQIKLNFNVSVNTENVLCNSSKMNTKHGVSPPTTSFINIQLKKSNSECLMKQMRLLLWLASKMMMTLLKRYTMMKVILNKSSVTTQMQHSCHVASTLAWSKLTRCRQLRTFRKNPKK